MGYMSNRTWELALLLGAFCVSQWPNLVFAKNLSVDDYAKSIGSVATVGGIIAIYKAWKSFKTEK